MAKYLQLLGESLPGGVNKDEVIKIVEDYLSKHPPESGEDGHDGYSPTVKVLEIEGGHRLIITDTNGDTTIDIMDGKNGIDGKDGADGKNGIDGKDGTNGKDGVDGKTPVKGVDYFTPEDVSKVAEEAAKLVTIDEVDPSKVIFPNGVKTTYEIGKVKLENGIGELVSPGGNLNEFFEKFMDEQPPETTDPSVSITFNQAKSYEVGTKVTPSYSASFDKGSYTYDDDTGVTVSAWSVKDTNDNSLAKASGSFPELTVSDGISYKITATATHSAGVIPKTNTGNPYADGQIKSGSKSKTSGALSGYRNTFYGTLTAKTTPTSSVIRGLSGKSGKSLSNGNSFTVTIPVGALRVVIAYPATLRDVTSIKDVNGMNAEIKSGFSKQTVSVEGAGSYKAIEYKVYTMDFASANDTANKYTVTI